MEIFNENSEQYQLPLTWFDMEIKAVLGIDVFSVDFPKSRGYQIIQGDFADILILKLESIRKCSNEAFNEFLNLSEFRLVTANNSSRKRYYPVYKEFLNLVDLPFSDISNIYDSKYMRHFYDEEEINAFWKKWHKQ